MSEMADYYLKIHECYVKKKKTTRKYKIHTYTCGRELEDQFILKLKGMGRRGEC